jgi:4-hydroxyphenylpyruvate dioxygenase-like putative hemolysin
MKFHAPPARSGDQYAPPNTLSIRRIAFAVDDIDAAVAGLQARGAELVGGVER